MDEIKLAMIADVLNGCAYLLHERNDEPGVVCVCAYAIGKCAEEAGEMADLMDDVSQTAM